MNRRANDKCPRCSECLDEDGHDSCLGTLALLMNACCGHGEDDGAYVQFLDGTSVRGNDAIIVMNFLKKTRNEMSKGKNQTVRCPKYGVMNFSQVLEQLKLGNKVRRRSWDKGVHLLFIDYGVGVSTIDQCIGGIRHPEWNAMTTDILAVDWEILLDNV